MVSIQIIKHCYIKLENFLYTEARTITIIIKVITITQLVTKPKLNNFKHKLRFILIIIIFKEPHIHISNYLQKELIIGKLGDQRLNKIYLSYYRFIFTIQAIVPIIQFLGLV